MKQWTEEEIEFLKSAYPNMGIQVAEILGRTTLSVKRKAERLGVKSQARKIQNNININSENWAKWYFVGLMYTDGNVVVRRETQYKLQYHCADEDAANWVSNFLMSSVTVSRDSFTVSKVIAEQDFNTLGLYGIIPRKSTAKFKDSYLGGVPLNYMSDYLRGCFDGDGTVKLYSSPTHRPRVKLYGVESFLHSIKDILYRLGFNTGKITKTGTIFQIEVLTENMSALLKYLYPDRERCPMKRKYHSAQEIIEERKRRGLS